MHLISKWRQYLFPFVFTLISPLCLDYICKIQCYLETRHWGPIITVEKEQNLSPFWTEQGVLKLSNLQCTFRHCGCNHLTFLMQAKSAMTAKEKLEKSGAEKVEKLTKQNMEREQQLTALLQETETRHSKKPNVIFLLFQAEARRLAFQ